MANISEFDEKMKKYFNTLPEYVQENIMQSNNTPRSYTELVSCCENIMRKE